MEKNWYLGLDMGTSSVGWAATDTEYKLLRAKGKDLWGIREFEEAEPAANRRAARISRRRNQREKARLGLVKSYFSDAINSVDPLFFVRLDNSKYYTEDKDSTLNRCKDGIFADENYHDADYYKEFPTIFHLRKKMIDGDENVLSDPRFVYLAIANMFHHRGHFLLTGVDGEMSSEELETNYAYLLQILEDSYNVSFKPNVENELVDILGNRELGRKKKQELVLELFGTQKSEKTTIEFIKCICGLSASAKQMFSLEDEEKYTICFNDYSYADRIPEITEKIGEDNYQILELMKQIYDYAALSGTLKGYEYLSEARIDLYEKHKSDLQLLKKLYKKFKSRDEYDQMFRSSENGTYSAYVHSLNSFDSMAKNGDGTTATKYRRNMSCKVDDLYSTIKKAFSAIKDDPDVMYVMEQIEKELFLPKQLTGANGIIPNQVHKKEMVRILSNAEKYLPFLNGVDESGLSVSERIVRLFEFQLPYYIGPVGAGSKTGWAIRKENGPVLPWNMSQKIDVSATAEEFIHRLIRECSYLAGEKVMPKASLEYEKYCVLNEINNICIDGERISPELKQQIFSDLYLSGKRVTKERLCSYLSDNRKITSKEQISGIDSNINNYLSSYGKMYAVFGEKLKEDKTYAVAEKIIHLGTIYSDSKEMLKSELLKIASEEALDDKQIKRILGYKFKDWGRYSKNLLELEGHDPETGEVISIIRALWEYPYNFMELINREEFGFKQVLEDRKNKLQSSLREFTADDLNDYYFSSPVKRMIWQTILVIKELIKVVGCEPQRVFIEMTRTDEEKGDKGRKNSREKQLLECYKEIKNTDIHNWKEEITAAGETGRLKSKKLFLYYCQMGRDAYTGEEIGLDELFDDNKYDIDHIYPRHFVKDDSILNNLVLVNKKANEHIKKDLYPIPSQISSNPKVRELWDVLHKKKLINDEKYKRLIGKNSFSEEQLAGFIARQLVETGQGTKGVAELLKQLIPGSEIVYAKAGNVSDFRRDNEFYKSRLLNEFHHANDAYLNIVVGNVYYTKFTSNPLNFISKEYRKNADKYHYNMAKMFDWDVSRNGYTAWRAGMDGTISIVRDTLQKNTPLMTRMSFEQHGMIANATLYSAKRAKPENYFPLKTGDERMRDVTKYGGFTSATIAYFYVVRHTKGKKTITSIEGLPLYLKEKIEGMSQGLKYYSENMLGYHNAEILLPKIKIQSLLKYKGYYYYLSGKTGNQLIMQNAVNLCLDNKWVGYINKIEKGIQNNRIDEFISEQSNIELFDVILHKHKSTIYGKRLNPYGEKIASWRTVFISLSKEEQIKTIQKLLQLTSIGTINTDLSILGGAAHSGLMLLTKNIDDTITVINTSPTGLIKTFQEVSI